MKEEITALQKLIDTLIEFVVNYSFQVVGAVLILIVGAFIANRVGVILLRLLEKKKIDVTLAKFLAGIVRISILAFTVLIALGKFGITIAPFVAALGALAFGTSFAIQGPLSNYGAGLSIIMARPFVVGDTITVAGVSGVVEEVKLAATVLTNEDGIKITIPNKHIVGEILLNSHQNRIVEAGVGISYDNDPAQAAGVVREALSRVPGVVKEPPPQVGVEEFGDSSINIGYRYWVPTLKYYQILYAVNLAVYQALARAGIKIPYPQREVRFTSQPSGGPSR